MSPTSLRRVDYQLAGAGKRPAVAWFDGDLVPDPAAALASHLGPLKSVAVEPPPFAPSARHRRRCDADRVPRDAFRSTKDGKPITIECAPAETGRPRRVYLLGLFSSDLATVAQVLHRQDD